MKVGVAVVDLFTGMYAVAGILAALRHAERTGHGQHLDVSLLDCQLAMLANQAMNFFVSGKAPGRLGNAHPNIAPYQVFASADGFVVLAVGNDKQFEAFCQVAGKPALAANARFRTNEARVANRAALIAEITALMATRTSADWISVLEAAGVPCGPINTIDQAFADPHVQARGAAEAVIRSDGEAVTLVRNPLRLSETPPAPRFAPPLLGQDTEALLRERLGADDEALAAWRAAEVI
jgi:crotonobetainyl-CoA:carnitine CoA-transferase CaiB-like acyl-CoA transferase